MGSTVTKSGVNVADGLFTVELDFGSGAFDGNARWLEVAVKKPADNSYTTLGRQKLTAAPYALGLLPGSQVRGDLTNPILSLVNTAPTAGGALYAQAQADAVPAINARHEGDASAIQAVASGIDAAIFALHQGSQPLKGEPVAHR